MSQLSSAGWLVLVFCLAGCNTVPLEEQTPTGRDLSGVWTATDEGVTAAGSAFRSGFMLQDFPLLVARQMRIEQDATSMGIEYDQGRYRDVSWGERRRGIWEVRAGWNEGDLHIYSRAPDTTAAEVWRMSADGETLTIEVEVRTSDNQRFRRTFARANGV